jgi:hypothetical protein
MNEEDVVVFIGRRVDGPACQMPDRFSRSPHIVLRVFIPEHV